MYCEIVLDDAYLFGLAQHRLMNKGCDFVAKYEPRHQQDVYKIVTGLSIDLVHSWILLGIDYVSVTEKEPTREKPSAENHL